MITISFSDLEWSLGFLYEVIIDPTSKVGAIVATHLSFTRLLDIVEATYKLKWPDCSRVSYLEIMIQRAQNAETERNKFVHSSYDFSDGVPEELLLRRKTSLKRKYGLRTASAELTISNIDRYLEDVVTIVSDVTEFTFWVYRTYHERNMTSEQINSTNKLND